MSYKAKSPYQFFMKSDGNPLEAGKIYIGVSGLDPETNPATAFWDSAATITAAQPIRTIAGLPDRAGTPSDFFTTAGYSITVRDKNDVLIYTKLAVTGQDGFVVSDFMVTVLDDPDAATARATLGAIGALSDDLTPQLGGALDTNGKSVDWSQGADVASAAELLVLRDGNSFNVTGALAITSIETTADAWPIGSVIMLKFTGAATLTHDAANLVLLGGANITVAAGDWAVFRKYAAGDWELASFNRGDAAATVGGTAGYVLTANGSGAGPTMQAAPNGLTAFVFKQNLAINSGTLFTNSSGGHDPLFYKCYLTCLTAEAGFTAGEVLPVSPNQNTGSGGNGFTIYIDTSGRLNGMFGVAASVFETLDQSTGATVSLTNANWDLTVIAYE